MVIFNKEIHDIQFQSNLKIGNHTAHSLQESQDRSSILN